MMIPSNLVFYDAVLYMAKQHLSTAIPVFMDYFSLKDSGGTEDRMSRMSRKSHRKEKKVFIICKIITKMHITAHSLRPANTN